MTSEIENFLAILIAEIGRLEADIARGALIGPQQNAMCVLLASGGLSPKALTRELGLAHSCHIIEIGGRRGNDTERAFWIRALERGDIGDGDLEHAIGLMTKHRALEDTMNRAQHYGAMAVDALALFPASAMKSARS